MGLIKAAAGAIGAQAAIPVVGWIALAIEAAIALLIGLKKLQKKRDEKNAESGVDSKGLRRLMKAAPLLMVFAIIILIIVIIIVLAQGETYDRVAFLQEAVECFESADGCKDFMNTGMPIHNGYLTWDADVPVIKKTDLDIATFVIEYKIAEILFFGISRLEFYVRHGTRNE